MYFIFNLTVVDFFIYGILSLCGYFLYEYYRRKPMDRIEMLIEKMPGQRKFPIIGTGYVLLFVSREDFFEFLKKRFHLYYGLFRNWIGSVPNVNLSKPEHAEVILKSSIQIQKSSAYNFMKPWLGDGLLISSGLKWQSRRKLLTPGFHFKILENSLETFNSKAAIFIQQLNKLPTGKVFDIFPYITRYALDAICETAMGIELNSLINQNCEYVDAIYMITDISLQRIVKPWLQPNFIFKYTKRGRRFAQCLKILHDFTIKMINERRRILNKSQLTLEIPADDHTTQYLKKKSFIDILLETSKGDNILSDEDIRQEVDTFLFEGHDTTAAAIGWCLFLLGNHLDIQDRVYKEILDALENHSGPINLEVLSRMKLLERCIKEALRLYPSVPIVARLLQKDIDIDGYVVPAGCTVNLYIFMVHRDPRYYDNPEKFDPDRFLPENIMRKTTYAYIPFSAGPRNCIGQKYAMLEEKVLLIRILKEFRVKAVETEETIKPIINLILRPLNGVRVLLQPRK